MQTFGSIETKYADRQNSAVWLQSIPYDGTSTYGKGADRGFAAFLEAADNLELYDIETDSEAYRQGIHLLPDIEGLHPRDTSPEEVYRKVYRRTQELLPSGKFLTFFGGEHSISIGIIKAFYEKYPDLTVLQIDAHADLRPSYEGSPYNHACAVHDARQNANLVQVGIRSMDISEREYLQPEKCFFAQRMEEDPGWMEASLAQITGPVYITIDLDALDPSIMPATGTPEPGGLQWYPLLRYLRRLFAERQVVGLDIVELAPIEGMRDAQFLAAKLYYKLISYYHYYDQ